MRVREEGLRGGSARGIRDASAYARAIHSGTAIRPAAKRRPDALQASSITWLERDERLLHARHRLSLPSLPPAFHPPSPPPPPRPRSLCPATCSSTFPTRLRLGRPPATTPTPSTPSLRGSTSARSSHPKRSSHLLRGQRHPSSDRPGYHLQGSEVTLTLMIALAIHHQPG